MRKAFSYRLFGLGGVPRKVRPVLESEGIVVCDEGMSGRFITNNLKAPGKRNLYRSEGFSGSLVITRKRIICHTYRKRQINIPVDEPLVSELQVSTPDPQTLSLSFESSDFREGWQGIVELRFHTEKALQFRDALRSLGAKHRAAADAAQQNADENRLNKWGSA